MSRYSHLQMSHRCFTVLGKSLTHGQAMKFVRLQPDTAETELYRKIIILCLLPILLQFLVQPVNLIVKPVGEIG